MSEFFNYFPLTSKESYFVPDLADKYKRLVSGLDSESAITVSRTLRILQALTEADANGAPHPAMGDVFTPDEISEILSNEIKLHSGIMRIADGAWAYGEYILPLPEFEYCTFVDQCGLGTFDHARVPADSVILDVGGYIGDTAILFHNYFPKNKIYSFEPVLDHLNLIRRTIELNDADAAIAPVQLALSDAPESVGRAIRFLGASRLDDAGEVTFPVDTLDNWMQKNAIGKIGLIKVDIEGAEQKFLKGAAAMIRRDRPVMLLSIYHNPGDYFGIKPMIEDMNLGYTFKIFKPMYRDVITETLLICIPE